MFNIVKRNGQSGLNSINRAKNVWDQLEEEMDDMFHSFGLSTFPALNNTGFFPSMEAVENEKEYIVNVELPGLTKEDVNINVTDNTLIISGQKTTEQKNEKDKVHFSELSFGSFRREMSLPTNAQGDNISASYKDGILKVIVPKKEIEKPKTKKISIE